MRIIAEPVQGGDEKLLNIRLVKTFQSEFSAVAEWIDRYLSDARAYPVLSQVQPGDIAAQLPACAPEEGEQFEALMADFERIVLPGITHWNSPRFFAYFATSAAPVAVAAEALAAALDVKAMLWRTSPSATELEEVVMRWLGRLMGLPDAFTGIIYDTASIGGFTALAAARESLDLGIREHGMSGRDLPVLRVYVTEHTHSHIEKACIALGVGRENVVRVPCDDRFQMSPDDLAAKLDADVAAGMRPMAVVATAGTTSTTSRDPIEEIASIARERNVWLHVDAAYAGVAAIMPEFRWVLAGAEHADSIVVNPHKWLFVPMDCSALYVRDLELLRRTFSLVPEYLRTPEESVRNYMDYGLQLGRRFRALKLWFVLRHFGAEGLRDRLRGHIALAQEFACWIEAEPGWEILAPHPLSAVCFRYAPPGRSEAELETLNAAIMERVNATGEVFLSHTKLGVHFALRLAIGNLRTTREDVAKAWELLRGMAAAQG
ncbi:MAG TPA: aminotransferase class I/II-fold pyridoxal phosphate-dependent enzyme [Candidatus Baltobacteraceae bacterium]|nr:aminotransferase class I/II-fold pyridoxal phosphate-dependent enzyme [Candidatus Baltobacteraceae bacterium]